MTDPNAPTAPAGSPIVPSALDLQVAADAAGVVAAPTELQILIGSLENLAAGVIPGLAAAGAAAVSPALSPEAAAAAALIAAELRSLSDAKAAAADPTAAAATGIAGEAIAPAIAKLPMIIALLLLGAAGAMCDETVAAPVRVIVAAPSWLDHVVSIIGTAMPYVITVLGALIALGKVVQPELAKRSPAIGNAIELVDHIADFIYGLLTSKAGKAEDAAAEAHTKALTGLLSQLQKASSEPLVQAAVSLAVSKLPAASQEAIATIQTELPVYLTAISAQTAPAATATATTDPAAKTAA